MSASAELVRELARFFARNPGARERLRLAHQPGPDGRCGKCRAAGDGSGRVLGCVLAAVLDKADERRRIPLATEPRRSS